MGTYGSSPTKSLEISARSCMTLQESVPGALEEEGELTIKMDQFHSLSKAGEGMRSFTDTFMDVVKDLKILQCGLPDSYIRLRFITLVKEDPKYTTYVNDFIISHMPPYTLSEVVVLMNSRSRKIGDNSTRRSKQLSTQQANAAEVTRRTRADRTARDNSREGKDEDDTRKTKPPQLLDAHGKNLCNDHIKKKCHRTNCRWSHEPAASGMAPP